MTPERGTIDLEDLLGRQRGTLAAAAHELKAPLSLIRMYAARLSDETISAEQKKQYNLRLLFTAEQMLNLTTGIVEGYGHEQGRLPLEPVNTNNICEEVLHELTPAARELGQQLIYQNSKRPLVAIGHPLLLKNVIFNIVFNALKHTPEQTRITIAATRQHDRTYVHISDTGPGFEKRTIRHINRGDGEQLQAAPSRSGSGLGLSVARQLTRAMNGTLQLKTSPSGGYCLVSLMASRQLPLQL